MAPKRVAVPAANKQRSILSFFGASSQTITPSSSTYTCTTSFVDVSADDRHSIFPSVIDLDESSFANAGRELPPKATDRVSIDGTRPTSKKQPLSADSPDSLFCGSGLKAIDDSRDSLENTHAVEANISETIRPFKHIDSYTLVCPFKAQGETCKSATVFKNLQAVAAHCNQKHARRIIVPFHDDPLQDGTRRIPCPKKCESLFTTYDAAMQHAKKCKSPDTIRDCPWPNCVSLSMDSRAYATHAGMHTKDTRGKYQCSQCDSYWCDLYLLASHEMRCSSDEKRRFSGCFRAELALPTSINEEAGRTTFVIAVARYSSQETDCWVFRRRRQTSWICVESVQARTYA